MAASGAQVFDVKDVKIRGFYVGMQVPDFEFTRMDGTTGRLSDFRGKVVLLDFWATWCAPCVAAMPKFEKALETYGEDGFVLLLASVDDKADAVERFLKEKKVPGIVFHVPGGTKGELGKLFNVAGVPMNFLIGRDGKVLVNDVQAEKLDTEIAKALRRPTNGGAPEVALNR